MCWWSDWWPGTVYAAEEGSGTSDEAVGSDYGSLVDYVSTLAAANCCYLEGSCDYILGSAEADTGVAAVLAVD